MKDGTIDAKGFFILTIYYMFWNSRHKDAASLGLSSSVITKTILRDLTINLFPIGIYHTHLFSRDIFSKYDFKNKF